MSGAQAGARHCRGDNWPEQYQRDASSSCGSLQIGDRSFGARLIVGRRAMLIAAP
jgi:hypothetical protein